MMDQGEQSLPRPSNLNPNTFILNIVSSGPQAYLSRLTSGQQILDLLASRKTHKGGWLLGPLA
jgi:hypothetical protein